MIVSIALTLRSSLLLLVSFEKQVHDIKVEAAWQALFVLKHKVADGIHCRSGWFPTGYDTHTHEQNGFNFILAT